MTTFESVLPNVATTSTAFGGLSPDQRAEIWSWARVRQLLSRETVVLQNTAADAIFVVVSGRFEVRVERRPVPLAEIGAGQPIGEIAFFAGGLRTATVVAVRDSSCSNLISPPLRRSRAACLPSMYNCWLASRKDCRHHRPCNMRYPRRGVRMRSEGAADRAHNLQIKNTEHQAAIRVGWHSVSSRRFALQNWMCQKFMEENMRALIAYLMGRSVSVAIVGAWAAVVAPAPAFANVITNSDQKAVAVVICRSKS